MPFILIFGRTCCCGGSGTSMNFGSSARIRHRDEVVEKERRGIEVVDGCIRLTELIELLDNEGGIL